MAQTSPPNVPAKASPGQCRYCQRRRPVVPISRTGGGNYRTAPRRYQTSICGECAVDLLTTATPGHSRTSGCDHVSLLRVVDDIDTDQARAVVDAYRTAWAAHEAVRRQDAIEMAAHLRARSTGSL